MVYNSLYDVLKNDFSGDKHVSVFGLHGYSGNLNSVFNDLSIILSKDKHSAVDIYKLIFHPTRILRGILDSDPHLISDNEYVGLINDTLDLCMKIYDYSNYKHKKIKNNLETLRNKLLPITKTRIYQMEDYDTWRASDPVLSKHSVDTIGDIAHGPIMLIPLANGGVSAGVDIFQRYDGIYDQSMSLLYPVRFSTHKSLDQMPVLRDVEISYIKEMSRDRTLIIFDEDSSLSAHTITIAKKYFEEKLNLFPYIVVNHPSNPEHHLIKPKQSICFHQGL